MSENMRDGVSIIIPTLNGGSTFDTCIKKIRHQDYSGSVQLIVIDSGSTDGTLDLAHKAGAVVSKDSQKRISSCQNKKCGSVLGKV